MADIVLDGLILPGDLIWQDEFQWCSVERSAEYSITGALLIEESTKLAGRPITLVAKKEFLGHIWLSRLTIESLYSKASIVGKQMTLILVDNRVFTVMFRDSGVIADPVYHIAPHINKDPYYLTLSLMTV